MNEKAPMGEAVGAVSERKVALIAGASSGIGEAFAARLAEDGYALVLVARREAELSRVAGLATAKTDLPVATVAVDLTEPGALDDIVTALEERKAQPEIVVNAAGFGLLGAADQLDLDQQLAMIDLNCRAFTALALKFLPGMRASGRGGIINISSTAAYMPGPNMAVYYATKAYELSFGQALSQELTGTGVTVTTVCPGATRTGFQKKAGMTGSYLSRFMPKLTAERVAEQGYAGFRRGRRLVVPGTINKLAAWVAPFVPRVVLLPVVRLLHKDRA